MRVFESDSRAKAIGGCREYCREKEDKCRRDVFCRQRVESWGFEFAHNRKVLAYSFDFKCKYIAFLPLFSCYFCYILQCGMKCNKVKGR